MNDGWKLLRILAEQFEDAQKARIACTNRMERGGVDAMQYVDQLQAMKDAEHQWKLQMCRTYRKVVPEPIRLWQQETLGIGEHLLARLLGVVGHPVHAEPKFWAGKGPCQSDGPDACDGHCGGRHLFKDDPFDRGVSDLWSYCGHGDPNRKRRKGMDADEAAALGNPRAKMLTHLLAVSCMKQRDSKFRKVYDERRAYTSEHRDWTDGHMHNDALRITAKEILKDLWIAARQ